MGALRKHTATILVAVVASGGTAVAMSGGSAEAGSIGTVYYKKGPQFYLEWNKSVVNNTKCPKAYPRVIGGGFYSGSNDVYASEQFPSTGVGTTTGTRAWGQAIVNKGDGTTWIITPYAICVNASVKTNF